MRAQHNMQLWAGQTIPQRLAKSCIRHASPFVRNTVKTDAMRNHSGKVELRTLAHARSGDKGDTSNIGLIALKPEYYPILVKDVTAERVKQHFTGICKGEFERFELPNLDALNFLLHESLGGGTVSLKTDPQGKTLSAALLRMEIEVGNI